MAEHASGHGAVEMGATVDFADHEFTYRAFLTWVKWGSIAIAVIVAGLFAFAF